MTYIFYFFFSVGKNLVILLQIKDKNTGVCNTFEVTLLWVLLLYLVTTGVEKESYLLPCTAYYLHHPTNCVLVNRVNWRKQAMYWYILLCSYLWLCCWFGARCDLTKKNIEENQSWWNILSCSTDTSASRKISKSGQIWLGTFLFMVSLKYLKNVLRIFSI